jgi:hypothetical protein
MSLLFANSALLPLLALAALPLLLHLFARARPPLYRFSSVELLWRVLRHTRRVKRPQDWLLLALRTLLIAALVLTFLQPMLFLAGGSGGGGQRNLVVIVDATASMAWVDGAQTRFAAACAEAAEVLSGLTAADTANVIWLDAVPDGVFPGLGRNRGYLQQALRHGRVTSEAGDINGALRLALAMLAAEPGGHSALCLVSDFQASAWQGLTVEIPKTIQTVRLRIGTPERPAANAALARISCDPAVPLLGEDATISCEVRNFGPQPRRCPVYLTLAEGRQSREVLVPAWGTGEAVFTQRLSQAGEFAVAAALDEDAFPGDDRRWLVATARPGLPVGLLDEDAGTAARWRQALAALDWARVSALTPDDLATGDLPHEVLLLAGWHGAFAPRLRAFVEQRGSVILSPAADLAASDLAVLTGVAAGRADSARGRWEALSPPRHLRLRAPADPLFRLFASGEFGDPAGGSFRGRWASAAGDLPGGGTVLLEYDDGVPALVRYHGSGSVFLWNLPLAPEHSDFAARVEFVPFLAELLLSCRETVQGPSAGAEVACGEPLAFELPDGLAAADLQLRDGAGAVVPTRLQDAGGRQRLVAGNSAPPGLYTWQQGETVLAQTAVSFPRIESDLRLQRDAELAGTGAVALHGGAEVRRLRDGIPLWPWLLAVALAAALAEGLALQWVERRG